MASNTLSIPPAAFPQPLIRSQPNISPSDPAIGVAQPGVPDALVKAIISQESGGRATAVGKAGEMGLMQITPAVAQRYNIPIGQLMDPATNRRVGTQYLQDLMKEFGGNLPMVLAAYNAGPARVKSGMIPESTRKYVRDVLGKIGSGIEDAISVGDAYGAENGDAWSHAKPISDPWASAKPVADPWKKAGATPKAAPNPIEAGYEKYIRDPARAALDWDPTGLSKKLMPEAARQDIDKMLVPDTATGAAINTALMATGLGEMSLPARLAIPTLAGAATGQATGSGSGTGALEGFGSAAGGELTGLGLGAIGRMAGKAGLLKSTTKDVGTAIGDELTNAGGKLFPSVPTPQTAEDLERLFTRGGIEKDVATATQPVRQKIANLASGQKFAVPVMTRGGKIAYQMKSLSDAEEGLTRLSDMGYTKGGDIRTMVASRNARKEAYLARGRMAAKLNRLLPGAGDEWLAARRQMGAAKALQRLFEPSNHVIDLSTGQIDQPALVKAILDNYEDLSRNLGPAAAERILIAARRNDLRPVVDILAHKPSLGVRAGYGGIHPHLAPGNTYKGVGAIPGYMKNQTYRTPAAVAIRSWLDSMGGQ